MTIRPMDRYNQANGMRGHRTRTLWIVAAAGTALTIAAIFVDPTKFRKPEEPDELLSTIEKAATYYEFEHYDRAAETYALAVEGGMEIGVEWFRYAKSVELSTELDLEKYVTAYRLLMQQTPNHDYLTEAEKVLTVHAVPFSYADAQDGTHAEGSLMVATGAIFRVRRGRIDGGVDTLFVHTKPDAWSGYLGEPIRVVAPKQLSYQSGETITVIGWYDGWCEVADDAGQSREYPCLIAAGVVADR
ncbi:MAG: hypothetical protein V3S41_01320 [Spirochaetia bacterium]